MAVTDEHWYHMQWLLYIVLNMEKQHMCNAELSFINWFDTESGMLR